MQQTQQDTAFKELARRLEVAELAMRRLPPSMKKERQDLMRMWRHVANLVAQASNAQVACRRRLRPTEQFLSKIIELEESLTNFEGYVTIAKLKKGAQ